MKHYKYIMIIGIDHGYGNIKTANTVTPTGITKLDAAPTFTKLHYRIERRKRTVHHGKQLCTTAKMQAAKLCKYMIFLLI